METLIKTVLSYANLSKNESSIKLAAQKGSIDASDPMYSEQGQGCFINYEVCISIDNKKYDIFYNEFYQGAKDPMKEIVGDNSRLLAKINTKTIEKTTIDGELYNLTQNEINLFKKFRELGLILVNYDTYGGSFKEQYRKSSSICSLLMDTFNK